ncbi:unnamed protein product, partial [Polarella glacialis]
VTARPALQSWRLATLEGRLERKLQLAVQKTWLVAARGCSGRRAAAEMCLVRRAELARGAFLARWKQLLARRPDPGSSASVLARPGMLAVSHLWSRWLCRARASLMGRERTCHMLTWRSQAHALGALRRWQKLATRRRATAMRSAALKEWAARSRLQRGWLDWRAWVLRRAREAVLGSGRRHALLLGMQVLQGWRLTTLCSSFARLRVVPRLAQQTLLAWRGEAAGSGLRRAADRAAEAHLLQLTVCSWQSVLAQGREGRQLADAHHFRRLAAMRRLSFTVWL